MTTTQQDRGDTRTLPWTLAGMAILALLVLLAWHFRGGASPAQQVALKARRADLVSRMQVELASASDAERSAVLATTDEDSQRFADQARGAAVELERSRAELGVLLGAPELERETSLLEKFSEDFKKLQRIDQEVLRLAVKNTNVKAYALAYGPAADALGEMDAALAQLAARHATLPDARTVLLLASGARIGALQAQVLLPPHIAEESNERMDRLEATMAEAERQVLRDLERLAALPSLSRDAGLALARARFATFLELKARILALSRENTNVASLALSLNQQRKAMVLCVAALDALQEAVLEEPIAGVSYGRMPRPTR